MFVAYIGDTIRIVAELQVDGAEYVIPDGATVTVGLRTVTALLTGPHACSDAAAGADWDHGRVVGVISRAQSALLTANANVQAIFQVDTVTERRTWVSQTIITVAPALMGS